MMDREVLTKELREAVERSLGPETLISRAAFNDEVVERWLDEVEFICPNMPFTDWGSDNMGVVAGLLNADPLPGGVP